MARIFYPASTRKKARFLRRQGFSFKEISQKLDIAKSTARLWTKNIALTAEHRKRLYTKGIEALRRSPNNSHERRKREIASIVANARKELLLPVDKNAFKLLGAMLYWAEGNKTKEFTITNSDPLLIKFMVVWVKRVFRIKSDQLKAHLNIYPQQNDDEIKKFWSELTKIPLENFGKSFIKPPNSNFKKNTLYYGTIKIRMRRGSNAVHVIFAWIEALLRDLKIEVDLVATKWHKLQTDYPRP